MMGINGTGERATICREGCAMTALAMALDGLGVTLEDGTTINPVGGVHSPCLPGGLVVFAAALLLPGPLCARSPAVCEINN